MKKKILGIICVRSGSKGIKNKNLLKINGKTLLEIAISQAKKSKIIDRLIVSTDSVKMIKIAKKEKVEVPFIRPANLSRDNSREWDVWRHALRFMKNKLDYKADILVSVPATSPIRSSKDIDNCIREFMKNTKKPLITVAESKRNPFFNMVKETKKNVFDFQCQAQPKQRLYSRRQDAPVVYDVSTIAFVVSSKDIFKYNHLYSKGVRILKFDEKKSLDIDNLHEYNLAKFFYSKKN